MRVDVCLASMAVVLSGCTESRLGVPTLDTLDVSSQLTPALSTDGTAIVDASGRQVLLRGVNAGGRSKFAPYMPFAFTEDTFDEALAAYMDNIAALGSTTLRVPFSWAAYEPEPGVTDEVWAERYDALLDAAWARGMWTIVDFHQDIYAEPFCGDGFPEWTIPEDIDVGPPRRDCPAWFAAYLADADVRASFDAFWADDSPVQQSFTEMWERMAARHADRPGVIGFEIINEPHPGTTPQTEWEQDILAPLYARVAAAIQAVDPDALVFYDISGQAGISGETNIPAIDGTNLVFAPHYYDFAALLESDLPLAGDVEGVLGTWADRGIEWDVPVLLGEFGIRAEHPDTVDYLTRHYDVFDARGMHATQWEASVSEDLWNGEDLSLFNADGSQRPGLVTPLLRPYIRALAGSDLVTTYDTASGVFTADWNTTADGVTELVLPEGAYGPESFVGGLGVRGIRDGQRLTVIGNGNVPATLRIAPQ